MSAKQLVLEKGQIWKTQEQYLHITELGKKLVHYRLLRTVSQKAARGRLANRREVLDFLNRRNATLLESTKRRPVLGTGLKLTLEGKNAV